MRKLVIALFVSCALVSACAQQEVLSQAPPSGTLPTGRVVLVDDGSCPSGQLREITGSTQGVERQTRCVPRPAR